jgi:hypothetical protein
MKKRTEDGEKFAFVRKHRRILVPAVLALLPVAAALANPSTNDWARHRSRTSGVASRYRDQHVAELLQYVDRRSYLVFSVFHVRSTAPFRGDDRRSFLGAFRFLFIPFGKPAQGEPPETRR